MKNTFKKCFALLMVVCLLVGSLPMTVFAATTQVSTLQQLQSALASASAGDVIDVTANIALTSALTVNGKVTVTSSNGSTVSRAASYNSYMFVVADGGELTLENITVDGNRTSYETKDLATEMIVVQAGGTLNFNDGTLLTTNRGNAAVSGGGIGVSGTLNMNGGTIANIHMHNSNNANVQYGAAITVYGGEVNMYGGMIGSANVGEAGQNDGRNGAVGVVSGTFNMHGGYISGNVANEQGGGAGGVHISAQGTFNMDGGYVTNNNSRRNGGGFYNQGKLNISGGTVSGNTANFANEADNPNLFFGGAIYNTGILNISGGDIINNVARSCGGAVYSTGTMTVSGDANISGNTSQRYSAGGIFVDATGTLMVTGGAITNNTAGQYGGAIAVTSTASNALVIAGGTFSGNNCGTAQCGSDIYITTANTSNVATSYIYECVTYTLYIDRSGSRYSPSNKNPATSNVLTAGYGYVYAASGDGHDFGPWETETPAGCTTTGTEKRTCPNCGKVETRTVAAAGHKPGKVTEVPADCENAGSRSYQCTVCLQTISETLPALGHVRVVTRVEADCYTDGYEKVTCSRCLKQLSYTELKSEGHKPGAWEVTKPATKTSEGEKVIKCTVCSEVLQKEVIPMIPDPTVKVAEVEAEVGEKGVQVPVTFVGNEGVWSMGFYVYYDSELDLKGVLAGDVFTKIVASPYNVDPATNARAKEAFAAAGVSTSGVLCYRFYAENSLTTNITNDGTLITLVFDVPDSDTYEFVVGIVPVAGLTINADAADVELITVDGKIVVPENDPCDHAVIGGWETETEATCEHDGLRVRKCENCGKVMFSEVIPQEDHLFLDPDVTPATCVDDGKSVAKCEKCGKTITTILPAEGHKPGEWVEEIPAGPTTPGLRTKRCTVCQTLIASEKIPATETSKLVVSSVEAEGNSTADITVSVEWNPGVWGMVLYVYYDEALELKTLSAGDVFTAGELTYNESVFNVLPSSNARALAAFAECGVATDGKKMTAVYFESSDLSRDVTANGVLLNLTFATPDVLEAIYGVGVVYAQEDVFNVNYEDVEFERVSGEVIVKESICDHEWSEWKTVEEAECEKDGRQERTCSVCQKTETKVIPALQHEYTSVIDPKPTCQAEGKETFTCSKCGDTYTVTLDKLPHELSDPVIVEATCQAPGSITTQCNVCKEKFVQTIPQKSHTLDNWTIEGDKMVQRCKECGNIINERDVTADPVLQVNDAAATVSQSVTVPVQVLGNPGFWAMRIYVYYNEALTLTGVANGNVVAESELNVGPYNVAPSANADAMKAFNACGVSTSGIKFVCIYVECNDLNTDNTVNGTLVDLTFTAPAEAGTYAVGIAAVAEEDIFNTAYETVDFALEAGNVTVTDYPPHEHSAGVPEMKLPTCEDDGYVVVKCTVCGEVMTEDILPAEGHKPGEWEIEKPATETENGLRVIRCTVCETIIRSEVIYATSAAVVTVSEEEAFVGEQFTVDVTLDNNPGIWGLRLYLVYDEALEVLDVANGDVFASVTVGKQNADASDPFFARVFAANGLSTEGKKVVCVYFEEDATADNTTSGTLFTATFAGVAEVGEYEIITIKEDFDAFRWEDGENVTIAHDNGYVNVIEEIEEPPAPEGLIGDVNGDGKITVHDLRLLKLYLAGEIEADDIRLDLADVNGDGVVNAMDVQSFQKLIAS